MTFRELYISNMAWKESDIITIITEPENNGAYIYQEMTVREAVDKYRLQKVLWFDSNEIRIDCYPAAPVLI